MKKVITCALLMALFLTIACGGGSGRDGATGEARVAASFLDNIVQKGDLKKAYDMLAAGDRAMLGMIPGFYDFITGKQSESMEIEMRLFRVFIKEATPIPDNVLNYSFDKPVGEGDTLMVPFTISYPEDFEDFIKENLGEELFDKMDNLPDLDLTFEAKAEVIKQAMSKLRSSVRGKKLALESFEDELMLIKENGDWKISLIASSLMQDLNW